MGWLWIVAKGREISKNEMTMRILWQKLYKKILRTRREGKRNQRRETGNAAIKQSINKYHYFNN